MTSSLALPLSNSNRTVADKDIREHQVGVVVTLARRRIVQKLAGHDALYNAGGAAIARSVAGTAGRFVGQEIDGGATYTYSPQLQISGGYSRILPGEFLSNTTPGESYNYAYLMFTYVFVGDRPVAVGKGQGK